MNKVVFRRIIACTGAILLILFLSAPSHAGKAGIATGDRDVDNEGDLEISEPAEVRRIQPGINLEEDSETTFFSDKVITGDVAEYSEGIIEIDGAGYRICDSVMVFGANGETISEQDIVTAETVKVFISRHCIRKIVILRAAN